MNDPSMADEVGQSHNRCFQLVKVETNPFIYMFIHPLKNYFGGHPLYADTVEINSDVECK